MIHIQHLSTFIIKKIRLNVYESEGEGGVATKCSFIFTYYTFIHNVQKRVFDFTFVFSSSVG